MDTKKTASVGLVIRALQNEVKRQTELQEIEATVNNPRVQKNLTSNAKLAYSYNADYHKQLENAVKILTLYMLTEQGVEGASEQASLDEMTVQMALIEIKTILLDFESPLLLVNGQRLELPKSQTVRSIEHIVNKTLEEIGDNENQLASLEGYHAMFKALTIISEVKDNVESTITVEKAGTYNVKDLAVMDFINHTAKEALKKVQ